MKKQSDSCREINIPVETYCCYFASTGLAETKFDNAVGEVWGKQTFSFIDHEILNFMERH